MALGGALGRAWAPVTPRHFVWQAWHKLTSTVVSRGRRGTNARLLSWHKLTSTVVSRWQAWHKLTSTLVLRGRRGTDGIGWRAWTGLGACDAAALCVAGVAQTHIYCRFTWQAWHKRTSTVVLRGRRGTDGIGWRAWTGLGACDAAARCVAGVAQTHIYCRFTWQAWHKLTSTLVLCGRRGTNAHLLSFCVAGVGQMALGGALGRAWAPVTPRHVVWQAWHERSPTVVSRGRRGTNSHLLP